MNLLRLIIKLFKLLTYPRQSKRLPRSSPSLNAKPPWGTPNKGDEYGRHQKNSYIPTALSDSKHKHEKTLKHCRKIRANEFHSAASPLTVSKQNRMEKQKPLLVAHFQVKNSPNLLQNTRPGVKENFMSSFFLRARRSVVHVTSRCRRDLKS